MECTGCFELKITGREERALHRGISERVERVSDLVTLTALEIRMSLRSIFGKLSEQQQVFIGTTVGIAISWVSFQAVQSNKPGHSAFDIDKPESVQTSMDAAEKIRLKNFVPRTPEN